ncbi:GNAT family N-acetyltransferase [Mycobacteroides salmoniphilum]|uniref:GNAT family N-acetyltransferase n=1 Tax=Mycobacteroides salmoniphilum TaxID=404941 RepID=UPI0009928C3B|nr:GNAT family N-acetyltransferase [Mycobacteroides salmoniphilum]QCH25628.1 Lysine N-acyltransferase MbtK [Mycobacteroides salmoniphilum]
MERPWPVLYRHVAPDPSVPAPPEPKLVSPFGVRLVDPDSDDTALIARWMRLPALVNGWEQDWPDERWYDQLKAQVESTYSHPYLVLFRDEPVGYLEFYRAAQDSIGEKYDADPYDLGIHGAIANQAMASKGFMIMILPKLIKSFFELEPRCKRIMFDPEHQNVETRRVFEHIGCTFLGEHEMPNRRMALYTTPRTPADVPAPLA